MAGLDLKQVSASLEEAFFGDEYFRQHDLISCILACRSFKDFRKLGTDSDAINKVFIAANYKPVAGRVITPGRALHIFEKSKGVQAECDFI